MAAVPLPRHTHCSGSGYVRGTYRGLTTELCTVRLTEVSEVQREETGLWEKNEQPVYTGQWMLCELGQEFPTWLTIWPRERLDRMIDGVINNGRRGEELEKAQAEARRTTPEKKPSIRERLEDAKRECRSRKGPDKPAPQKKPPELGDL